MKESSNIDYLEYYILFMVFYRCLYTVQIDLISYIICTEKYYEIMTKEKFCNSIWSIGYKIILYLIIQ